jgi:hypothetical protein
MIWTLRLVFLGVLVTMLVVTGWASSVVALWKTPREVVLHPWFIATLFDTYFAFLTFWLWLAWRERTWPRRVLWLVAILLLGNIAMAAYLLAVLFRLPSDAPLSRVLMREEPGRA